MEAVEGEVIYETRLVDKEGEEVDPKVLLTKEGYMDGGTLPVETARIEVMRNEDGSVVVTTIVSLAI